jgi:hypothetical protein
LTMPSRAFKIEADDYSGSFYPDEIAQASPRLANAQIRVFLGRWPKKPKRPRAHVVALPLSNLFRPATKPPTTAEPPTGRPQPSSIRDPLHAAGASNFRAIAVQNSKPTRRLQASNSV